VPDGVNEDAVAGDAQVIAVTATTTTEVQSLTPIYNRWPGAKKLRLKTITNADTDASSRVVVKSCSFNTFIP
jgi:hypothetical protein